MDTVENYIPSFFPQPSRGAIARADGSFYAGWESGPGWDRWGADSIEYGSLRTISGVDYAYVDGYRDANGYYPVQSVRDLVTMPDGRVIDLAASGVMGSSYMPWNLPDSGVITIEQWFFIFASINRDGRRPGYWKSEFTFGAEMGNPGWLGRGPTTRRVVKQREVWWDNAGGWARGHPVTAGAVPWVGETPQDVAVVFDQVNYIGKDAGPLWAGTNAGVELHLKNVEFYGGAMASDDDYFRYLATRISPFLPGGAASPLPTSTIGKTAKNSDGAWSLGTDRSTLLNSAHVGGGYGVNYKQIADTVWAQGDNIPPHWYRYDAGNWIDEGTQEPTTAPMRTAPTPPTPPPVLTPTPVPTPTPTPTPPPTVQPIKDHLTLMKVLSQNATAQEYPGLRAQVGDLTVQAYAGQGQFYKIGREKTAWWAKLVNGGFNLPDAELLAMYPPPPEVL